jgi:hypothetical protein
MKVFLKMVCRFAFFIFTFDRFVYARRFVCYFKYFFCNYVTVCGEPWRSKKVGNVLDQLRNSYFLKKDPSPLT